MPPRTLCGSSTSARGELQRSGWGPRHDTCFLGRYRAHQRLNEAVRTERRTCHQAERQPKPPVHGRGAARGTRKKEQRGQCSSMSFYVLLGPCLRGTARRGWALAPFKLGSESPQQTPARSRSHLASTRTTAVCGPCSTAGGAPLTSAFERECDKAPWAGHEPSTPALSPPRRTGSRRPATNVLPIVRSLHRRPKLLRHLSHHVRAGCARPCPLHACPGPSLPHRQLRRGQCARCRACRRVPPVPQTPTPPKNHVHLQSCSAPPLPARPTAPLPERHCVKPSSTPRRGTPTPRHCGALSAAMLSAMLAGLMRLK